MDEFPIEVDKNSPVPIYYQLQHGIATLIEEGGLRAGQPLPSENELSRVYSISPMTVRQAMARLVDAGYIYRQRGKGTFVSNRPHHRRLERLTSFTEEIARTGMRPSARILHFGTAELPQDVGLHVNLAPKTPALRIKRLRLVDEQPVGIHDAYLVLKDIQITRSELEQKQSLYQLLGSKGLQLRHGDVTIAATAADEEAAQLLHVTPGSPLLRLHRYSWSVSSEFVEYVAALYRADLYEYTIRLLR
ncbi:MAG: GntR family transcriptional regulator [Candidatus Promineifilaceae bacterium]|nr:GntR family transcriptional regulator [Candidatus Promineifilaceae bacterium]